MGLAGRKFKQRIANDPRNLSWADDAARFGINYLAKFGWDSSKGLGASGEGRKSHLEVSKKLDMLGIGAAHQLDPNGIAWKQNKDFENLLKRLNGDVVEGTAVEGFEKADSDEMAGVGVESFDSKDEGTKKKRKGKDNTEAPKKKKKIERGDENPRVNESINLPSEKETASSGSSEQRRTIPTLPRHRAHRARAIAAKNLSSKSAVHISEILGIPPTPSLSTTATSSGRTSGTDTPQGVIEPTSNTLEIGKITTATRSVDDYFKEKLKTKQSSTFINPFASSAQDHTERDTSHDALRAGLGSSSRTAFGSTLSSTFLAASKKPLPSDDSSQTEVVVETHAVEESAVVAEDDARSLREKKERKTVDVGEFQFKRLLDREDKSKKNTAAREDPLNFATKKKKGGKRKKRNTD